MNLFFKKNKNEKINNKSIDTYSQALELLKERKEVRVSSLQRLLNIKFVEATSIINRMLEENIIYEDPDKISNYLIKKNYNDLIDVDSIPESKLDEIANQAFATSHLINEDRNQILVDGRTLEQTLKDGYKGAILSQQKSKNPKFHRTPREKDLSFDFYQKNQEMLKEIEEQIYDLDEKIVKIKKNKKYANQYSEEEIKNICKKEIDMYQSLKRFCYSSGQGGIIYFQDMWEYCHYNWDDCFPFIQKTQDYYNSLLK